MSKARHTGFTLAELLIALAILGEIATFTIPKIINAQANSRNAAVAKEFIATASNAVYLANANGVLTTASTMGDLTPYMNYVAVDTTSSVDGVPSGAGSMDCASYRCLRLHSGALMLYSPITSFVTTSGIISAIIDADGRLTSQNDSLGIVLYYNGKITAYGDYYSNPAYTPSWFTW
jgi:prepilin-type N-terminal cleavage/methylation domain-containing protein